MSTCNRLDLQTLGSQPIKLCPKISPVTGLGVSVHTKVTALNLIQKKQWIPRAPKDNSFLSVPATYGGSYSISVRPDFWA